MILELPLEKIRRPLMRTRANDPNKVKELMDSISEIGLQVPVSTCFPLSNFLLLLVPFGDLCDFVWFLGKCFEGNSKREF